MLGAYILNLHNKLINISTAGITCFPNTNLGWLIWFWFGLEHNENDLVVLYDT